MKAFHNATIGKYLVVGFAIAVHGVFGLGAYYLGLFISSIILRDAEFLVQPAAILFAVLVFAGAMWGFIYMEYAKEDVDAYSHMSGKKYGRYLIGVQIAIAGLELSSLGFRCYQVHNQIEQIIVGAVGLLALVIAFCLGKVIHAMANRPFDVAVYRAQQEAGRSLVDDAMKHIGKMSADQKSRFYAGDPTVIDEVQQASAEQERSKRRGRDVKEAESERVRTFTNNLLRPKQPRNFPLAQVQEADSLSHNGRH